MKGKTCLAYLNKIEQMANAVCEDSDFKDEYYETDNELVANDVEEDVL